MNDVYILEKLKGLLDRTLCGMDSVVKIKEWEDGDKTWEIKMPHHTAKFIVRGEDVIDFDIEDNEVHSCCKGDCGCSDVDVEEHHQLKKEAEMELIKWLDNKRHPCVRFSDCPRFVINDGERYCKPVDPDGLMKSLEPMPAELPNFCGWPGRWFGHPGDEKE